MHKMKKLLIANRGEIAVRVIRAAREMGIRTVAVYSEADADALHTKMADEKVLIGPPDASESYLRADKILNAAKVTNADAIHPGYGFLSERADFSEACSNEKIMFVGPPAHAMRALGSKIAAKSLAEASGVPLVPGMFKPGATDHELLEAAREIGFPVMLKASAGGGGRGMRVVASEKDFLNEFAVASDEALRGFGDGEMMVEKYIDKPRHVEVQILADTHGNVAALFERDCSAQRRHQKLIEESPSPGMTPEMWQSMERATHALAKSAGYVSAGTFEYIVDDATGNFYFLEVNARLQVEHPVTEFVTGLDLVQWQLRIARGESLAEIMNVQKQGHAIEARIVAENPANAFAPSIGKILAWAEPHAPGVRVDTGYGPGAEVSRFYDSLIAKVIVHAETRNAAIEKLILALRDFHILGVNTNIEFLIDLLDSHAFRDGTIDTGYIGRVLGDWRPSKDIPNEIGELIHHARTAVRLSDTDAETMSFSRVWSMNDDWRIATVTAGGDERG